MNINDGNIQFPCLKKYAKTFSPKFKLNVFGLHIPYPIIIHMYTRLRQVSCLISIALFGS